jgi:hypothetical protein
MKYARLATIFIFPFLLLTAWLRCVWADELAAIPVNRRIVLSNEPNIFRQELMKHISVGSSVTEARALLEQNLFSCAYLKSADEATDCSTFDPKSPIEGNDNLFCFRQTNKVFCATTYKPSIAYDRGKVTKVDAYIGGWCL